MEQAYLTCLHWEAKGEWNTEVDFCFVQIWYLQERNLEGESYQTHELICESHFSGFPLDVPFIICIYLNP